jgi:hypothetical protein
MMALRVFDWWNPRHRISDIAGLDVLNIQFSSYASINVQTTIYNDITLAVFHDKEVPEIRNKNRGRRKILYNYDTGDICL